MKAAIQYPSLFRALVLIEPILIAPSLLQILVDNPQAVENFPLLQRTRVRRDLWPDRQSAFEHFRPKSVFKRWSDDALWDFVNYGLQENALGEVTLTFPREWEARIYSHFPLSVWREVQQVTQPTLAIRGAESDTIFPEAWQLWQEKQPQAQFVEIPDAGHMVTMERPQYLAEVVRDYLSNSIFEV